MRFWDASAIVPLHLDEAGTAAAQSLLKGDDRVAVWWGTIVECASVLARRVRRGECTPDQQQQALHALRVTAVGWNVMTPSREVRDDAMNCLRLYALSASDALQLGAALTWALRAPAGLEFVSLDRKLREAARSEGFTVLPE